jgi:predicted nucleic acid-binding protein
LKGLVTLDASVAAAWLLPDEASEAADNLYAAMLAETTTLQAPALWTWELGNLLRMASRRGRLTDPQLEQALGILGRTNVALEPPPDEHRVRITLRLAQLHTLTFYDAAYLEQAQRTGAQLASKDRALRLAAARAGVPCLDL